MENFKKNYLQSNLLNLVFLLASLSSLINGFFYGIGYSLIFIIIFIGVLFKNYKLNLKILPNLFILLITFWILLAFHTISDITIYIRILMILAAIFFSTSCRKYWKFTSLHLVNFLILFGFLTSLVGIKQFFYGFSSIEYILLSYNDSMQEELIDQNIKRGLGIFFDPLTQVTVVGIATHSLFYVKTNFKINKLLYLFLIPIFFIAILITLSRAGIIGLLLSFLIYFNPSKIKYFISILFLSIIFILFSIYFYVLFFDDLTHINNLFDSFLSIGQAFNIDVEVSSRFSSTGSYGSRMEGIKEVLSNIFNTNGLYKISKNHSARDLGFFALPVLYGFPISFITIIIILKIVFEIMTNFFFATGFYHFCMSIAFFMICQSIVSFQLDSFFPVFILFFFLKNK